MRARGLVEGERIDRALQPLVAAALRFCPCRHGVIEFLHDVIVAAAVSIAGDFDLHGSFALQAAVVEFPGVEIELHRAFAAGEVHSPLRNRIAHRRHERNPYPVAEFRDRDRVVHEVGVSGERGADRVRIPPGAEGLSAVFLHEFFVLRDEEVAPAERGHPGRKRADEPVDEIEVVAALFQNVRAGVFREPPPVAHDVAAMLRRDVFAAVDRDEFAEFSGVEQLLCLAVDRRVPQNETGREKFSALPVRLVDFAAVVDRSGQRFFGEDVLARLERREDSLLVIDVGGEYHDPLHAGSVDRLFDAVALFCDAGVIPDADRFGHDRLVRIVGRQDFDPAFGIPQQIADHSAPPAAGSQNGYADFLLFRHILPRV